MAIIPLKKSVYTAKPQNCCKSEKSTSRLNLCVFANFLRFCGVKVELFIASIIVLCLIASSVWADEDSYFSKLREEMVKTQIEARGIKDKRVLEVMRKVKRHQFVPQLYKSYAYKDTPLPIGEGQTISQPYIVALMTELLGLTGKESVLEIGTGSGYQAAILAELAAYVYTIEILPNLAERAEKLFKNLGYKNIMVKCGDGYLGWEEYAPFDAIIVTCAPEDIPRALVEQLADSGRMVLPVGSIYQELKLIEKKNGEAKIKSIIPVRFVPMIHSEQE
jgi:protein-L-isoaspartate(D-aspartate) O-methyltransferase